MTYRHIAIVTGLIVSTVFVAGPAQAAGLLGTGLGGSGGSIADVKSGSAGSNSLVNVGVGDDGGSSGNIADVKIGRSTGLNGDVNVSGTGNGLDGDVNLGFGDLDVTAGIDLGSGLGIDIGVGGGGDGGTGGPGGPGGPGAPGGPGLNGGNGGLRFAATGVTGLECSLAEGRQVLQLAASGDVSTSVIAGWQRAANVRVVPFKLCPAARSQVSQILSQSPKINALQGAAAADMLISASLSRTRYDANDVFAVQRSGSALTVYVF